MTGWPLTTVLWELEGEAQRGGPETGAASPSQVQGDQPELVLTSEGGAGRAEVHRLFSGGEVRGKYPPNWGAGRTPCRAGCTIDRVREQGPSLCSQPEGPVAARASPSSQIILGGTHSGRSEGAKSFS